MTNIKHRYYLVTAILLVAIILKRIAFGNPLFSYFARNTVENYIAENYENCYIDGEIEYDAFGLFMPQIAIVKSYDNPDFCINVYTDITGLFINQQAMEFFNE